MTTKLALLAFALAALAVRSEAQSPTPTPTPIPLVAASQPTPPPRYVAAIPAAQTPALLAAFWAFLQAQQVFTLPAGANPAGLNCATITLQVNGDGSGTFIIQAN